MKTNRNEKIKRAVVTALAVCICLGILGAAAVFALDAYVKSSTEERIIPEDAATAMEDVDCILVLGCLVRGDGSPSHMLSDRIDTGISLYKTGAAPKLLMSGDHGRENYDEVGTMKDIAVAEGIPSADVFEDHAGFSTYESLYRAKEIFGVKKVIIVTQKYHLYRALYIARSLGIEAYGVHADLRTYSGQMNREVREILARVKDFGTSALKPEPTYLGEFIPISGDGDITEG
ncbi:MAG: SanA protein [Ruminococcaceae bacterium]|nr:SanA protein [Oscillospiraceae bacterium]